jgi:hypothetical protein
MALAVDEELRVLCVEIRDWMDTEPDWQEIEGSDMFESEHYSGGWEGEEDGFTFSHYDDDGEERWFSLSPAEIRDVANSRLRVIETREPE